MNAQEAIENTENLKIELINLPASLDEEIHKQIEGLSIVLCMAKEYHATRKEQTNE